MKAIVQLEFDGRCRVAFGFCARTLGGEIKTMNALGETKDVALPPGRGRPDESRPPQGFNVALHVRDKAAAQRVFEALADGGSVATPSSEAAWSSAFGMLRDRFGAPWLILSMDE